MYILLKNRMWRLLIIFLAVPFAACSTTETNKGSNCIQNRAAIEIGSGTTKIQIATVNVCDLKIIHSIVNQDYKIDFKEDLRAQKNHEISIGMMKKALAAFSEMKTLSEHHGVLAKNTRAVATAVFREAKNSTTFLEKVREETGISTQIISQQEEAELGLLSVRVQHHSENMNLVVWDIGGGSLQLITQDEGSHDPLIYEGHLASVNFKNTFIEQVRKEDPVTNPSPNPVQKTELKKAFRIVEDYLVTNKIPSALREKSKELNVYGIGGVLATSLPGQIQPKDGIIRYSDILNALDRQLGKSDAQLQSKYATTEVTNLILVAAYMKDLGLEKYYVANSNNTSGLLVEKKYWR